MIYLIDRGFRIKSALNILVNQCKYPAINNECFCLGCNVNQGTCFADDNDNVNVNLNDNDNINDNDNVNDSKNDNDSVYDNIKDNDNDKDSVNDNVNDKDNYIYLFDEKHGEASVERVPEWTKSHQKGKPNNITPTSDISVNINEDLQSWLNDDDIITEDAFPDNFR